MTDTNSFHPSDNDAIFAILLLALSALLAAAIFYPIHSIGSSREAVRAALARELLDTPAEAQEAIDIRNFLRSVFGKDFARAYSLPSSKTGSLICTTSLEGGASVFYLDRLKPGPAGTLREAFPLDGLEDRMIRYCDEIVEQAKG